MAPEWAVCGGCGVEIVLAIKEVDPLEGLWLPPNKGATHYYSCPVRWSPRGGHSPLPNLKLLPGATPAQVRAYLDAP